MADSMRERRNEAEVQAAARGTRAGERQATGTHPQQGAAAHPQRAAGGSPEQPGQEIREQAGAAKEQLKEKARGVGGRLKGSASDFAEARKTGVAGRIDQASDRVEERAQAMEAEGGLKRKAGQAAHRASSALEDSADYLRTHHIGSIRDDVQSQIQGHPFLSMGVALGTGYMLGRVFGGEDEEAECERLEEEWGSEHEPGMMDRLKAQARGPLGRAAMSGVGALVASRIRNRVSGHRA